MAIIAGDYDFEVRRRSDNTQELALTDANDNPVNLSGFQIAASVFNEDRTTKFADFTVSIPTPSNGTFFIKLTRTQTATFTPNELHYDVKLKDPSDNQEYYVAGIIFVKEGYTEFPSP